MPGVDARLPRDFYARETALVARELLGCRLFRRLPSGEVVEARIIETEGYLGPHDQACHTARGRTPRTEVMFGPAGHAYVYMIYGMHFCLNFVTERVDHGSAALIRAVEAVPGGAPLGRCDGPARLCRTLGIGKAENGLDLVEGDALWVLPARTPPVGISAGPRVGVDYAGEWAAAPLRFWESGNRGVSPVGAAKVPRR